MLFIYKPCFIDNRANKVLPILLYFFIFYASTYIHD